MTEEASLCLTLSEIPEDTYSGDEAYSIPFAFIFISKPGLSFIGKTGPFWVWMAGSLLIEIAP